jgi:hypothetical protein
MINYYLRSELAHNLKKKYADCGQYVEKAKEFLNFHSPQDIAALTQLYELINKYYVQETKDAVGLSHITLLKTDIPWTDWRIKSCRILIEIAVRRFYKNNNNARERVEYYGTDLPPETKENKDIYTDDNDHDSDSGASGIESSGSLLTS